ncbi:MAG: class I SAM-dependent methyltransferase [Candidatus Pacebacteria bacterium]|nr:class I SAM-dependent methyltransferase [Candidatus Paceibacterota bacterium]MDD5357158.1 class I SAM-dependent methyltransferase [Candidatus Paceibacterota bacterium]
MKVEGFKDTIDWYDNNSEQYAKGLYEVSPTASIQAFLEHIPQDAYVLEAGCGPGRESKIFHEKGIKTVGIDMSEGLLEVARKMNPETEFVKGNFLELPFPDATFGAVWAHASLVHLETIEDAKKALEEFHRVLKSGGTLLVKVKAQTGEDKTAVVTDTLSKHDRFFRYYTPENMEALLIEAGFEIISNTMLEDDHGRSEVKWIQVIVKKL